MTHRFFTKRIGIVVAVFSLMVLALVIGFTPSQKAQGPEPSMQEQQRPPDPRLAAKYGQPDRITAIIRNKSTELVRVRLDSFGDRAAAARIGTIVEDYGSFLVIAKNKQANLDDIGLETQSLDTAIHLPGRKFEPTKNAPPSSIIGTASSAPGKKDYYIVQFGSIAQGEWIESLGAMGAEVIQYVPSQAFFVYADSEAMAKIAGHSRVRWVGRYTAEDKLSPELSEFTARVEGATVTLDVAVFNSKNPDEAAVEIAGISGGQVRHVIKLPSNFFNVVRIEMPKNNIRAVAELSGVFRIDQYEKPMPEDERAAQIIAGNYTNPTTINPPGYNSLTQFLVDGTNVTVGVADDGVNIPGNGGFYITASNTSNGPLRGAAAGATGGHGHLNASIIAGDLPFGGLDPTGYNYALGVARKANILNIPFLVGGYTGVEADTVNDIVTTPGVNGVNGSISNNSWGNGTNANSYDAYAAMFDGFVQDASAAAPIDPILLVFSAGNSGASGLTRPKVAKNLIAVGSSENLRTELSASSANNMDDLSSFSSRGPAADGRVKPDITAPGDFITGSRSGTGGSVSGQVDANHSFSSGTSHACPQVVGAAALFTQFWKTGNGGVNPSPALVKAAILNTGQEMNGVGSAATIPNGGEGWGRINMSFMLNTGVPTKYVNQVVAFSNPGENSTTTGTVANAAKPIRVSLVWTDPPGAGNPALVNNLDLTVTVGGTTFKGNVFAAGSSTTGGSADTLNNVENVFIPAGTAVGTAVAVQVSATALNGNGILGNADATDQHFALVVYNFTETAQAVMAGGAPVITAEGRTPANNAPDPGEAITANLPISNVGTANTASLVATLQNSGGVTAVPTGENQNYGAVLMGGPAVTRPFTFRADGACGSTVTATLALQDGATNLGTVGYTFQLGTNAITTAFTQNFDGVGPPALPAGWTTAVTGSGVAFVSSATNPSSAPNDAFAPDQTTTGTSELVSPSIPITSAAAQVTFRNLFNTESTFDGLVLEISIGAGAFTDIVAAGGSFASGGYNGSITQSGTCTDPLNGRSAWTGLSGGTAAAPTYITSVANLPAAANGQNIRLKWLIGHDCSIAPTNPGARVDTISISSTAAVCVGPTAAPANVSGRITDGSGVPVGGAVMNLSGSGSRTTITDSNGNYRFDNLDTGEFYTVTPSLANYHFSPADRSFSLIGNMTDAAFTATADASQSANAIDSAEYFVRQQYLDFLGREPDQGGLEFWSSHINACGSDSICIREKRVEVSAAFFMSGEFQETGSYVYDMYAGLLGRTPGFNEFTPDRAQVIGGSGLDKTKTAFAGAFVQRSEFTSRYPAGLTRDQFVDAVLQTMQQRSGVDLSSQRNGLLADYDTGGRALVARHAAESGLFVSAEYNRAFVLMEYFGYLRRGEDTNGYQFWLNVLNQGSANNYRGMVCSFLTSTEYQHRFSSVVTHNNGECGQ